MFRSTRNNIALLLAVLLSISTLSGFGYNPGIGNITDEFLTKIAPALLYEQHVAVHDIKGVERGYLIEANLLENTKPYVFSGKVVERWKLSSAIDTVTKEGFTVVAGINGDFYDTKLGNPLGLVIHERKIKTSGANYSQAIGFNNDGMAFVAPVIFRYDLSINSTTTVAVHHINKPQGIGEAIHFFNSEYADSTRTTTNNVEVIVSATTDSEPTVNGTVSGTVLSVNPSSSNAAIQADQFILSTATGTSNAAILTALLPGDQVSMTVTDTTDRWATAMEAIGAYQIIAENGTLTTSATGAEPRTCLGIKEDGSILLYAVDGRNPDFSNGISLSDVAAYLVSKGCKTVINMDGGGSTTIAVRMPGDPVARVVNKPSGGVERPNSNSILFVETVGSSGKAQQIHLYPMSTYAMPGSSLQFTTKSTDERYRMVSATVPAEYQTSGNMNSIDKNGLFQAGTQQENVTINAAYAGMRAVATVKIVDDFSFAPNLSALVLDSGESYNIDLKLSYLGNMVVGRDDLFQWTCDPSIGGIDKNGLFTAVQQQGVAGNVRVSYRDRSVVIPVQVGEQMINFNDTIGHWAQQYIGVLAARKIISGMGEGLYLPDQQLTRSQFVKLLAMTVPNLDLTAIPNAGFLDVSDAEWYSAYVNWAYQSQIVKGTSETTFGPDLPITREQMAVMLRNYATAMNFEMNPVASGTVFTDESSISQWASTSVQGVVDAGIMNGTPEGSFAPLGNATRAQAAKVIYRMVVVE